MAHEGAADSVRSPSTGNTWPGGRSSPTWTGLPTNLPDSVLDAGWGERGDDTPRGARWKGQRLALLIVFVLIGTLIVALTLRALADTPRIAAQWRIDAQGRIELAASNDPALRDHVGQALTGVMGPDDAVALPDALALQRTPRWVVEDADRQRQQATQALLVRALSAQSVRLFFADGSKLQLQPAPRGLAALPIASWLLFAAALALYTMAVLVLLRSASSRNVVYAAMALCQAGNMLLMAAETALEFGLPAPLLRWGMPLHIAFDLFTAAAMVNAACLHPRRLPGSGWIAIGAWGVAFALVAAFVAGTLPSAWWWIQLTVIVLGGVGIGLLSWSYQIEPHPFAIVLRQFGIVTASTWALLTMALAASDGLRSVPHNIADTGAVIWYVYLAALLMLVPFLAKSQNVLREFALLAAVGTVAISLYLLFVAVFSLGQLPALTLSLFVSLGVYSAVRQWILSQLIGSSVLTTERMFEQLYRIAREVEGRPERVPTLLSQLLSDLFEPLEVNVGDLRTRRSRVAGDGSSMLIPVPVLGGAEPTPTQSILIRFAQRGRRLFTAEDARLTDRVVEQLRRAVHFDKAVEQGRHEERLRLAQDLHDDIGARLLTLMYKAQSPEMEDYVRHTLQDLKTLTRGLAASNHRLSHAAAEWKADLSHRLTAAHVELKWVLEFDVDILLTVVHWSALTRILRELVSNAIAHSQAQQLEIDFRLLNDRLELTITDDGVGRDPRAWSHGLGLGGVRKRVKQLGGEVEWREVQPHGIRCSVVIRDLTARWQL